MEIADLGPLGSQPSQGWDSVQVRRSTSEYQEGPDALRLLALQGSWRAVADRTKAHRANTAEDRLTDTAWHIFALAKLRQYGDAARVLDSLGPLDLGDSGGKALRVPFALRWLQAQLPLLMGRRKEGAMQLYNLLDFCQRQQNSTSTDHLAKQMWKSRHEMVTAALINHHIRYAMLWDTLLLLVNDQNARAREFVVALRWLELLCTARPDDAELLSRLGYVQLCVGDLKVAAATFQKVVELVAGSGVAPPAQEGGQEGRLLVRRNRGLLLFAEQDYKGTLPKFPEKKAALRITCALAEFSAVLTERPGDAVAANNRAICHMYSCNLPGALQSLEGALQEHPAELLRESVLLNLCSMYELSSSTASMEAKRKLSAWAARSVPDDFDLSCIRSV